MLLLFFFYHNYCIIIKNGVMQMKKKIILIIMVCGILLLTGCSHTIKYTKLNFSQIETKLENKETFVLIISSSTCPNCVVYKEVIEKTKIKDKLRIYYINVDDLMEEEYSKLYSKYAYSATPTTIFIKNGIEESTYNRIIGRISSNELIEQLKKQGYIGE